MNHLTPLCVAALTLVLAACSSADRTPRAQAIQATAPTPGTVAQAPYVPPPGTVTTWQPPAPTTTWEAPAAPPTTTWSEPAPVASAPMDVRPLGGPPPVATAGKAFSRREPSFQRLQSEARSSGKTILVLFDASWCGFCQQLHANTLHNSRVIQAANRHVTAGYDADRGEGKRLSDQYGVAGFPTLLLLDSSGRVLDKWGGYEEPGAYAGIIESMGR